MSECRVAAIGRELAELSREWDRLDNESIHVKGARKHLLERVEDEVCDRIELLKAEACAIQAASVAGALVQAVIAYDLASQLNGHIPGDVPLHEVGPPMRALARALYSAVDAMAEAAGEPPDAFGAGHFMSRDLHPFRLNERMAGESKGVG